MADFPILSAMLLVPLVAAVACLLVEAKAARTIALVATAIDFVLGVLLWANYDIGGAQWQFVEKVPMFAGFSWALGIDGIALNDFDYIDIGELIPASGAVPVVIKSLIFPASVQRPAG